MKNKKILIVPVLVIAVLIAFASWSQSDAKNPLVRVVITPNTEAAAEVIANSRKVKVMHEFDDKFTADVRQSDIEVISAQADVQEVVIMQLVDDEILIEDEIITEEVELTDKEKEEKKKKDKMPPKKPFVRDCFPLDKKPYNVEQVNGGQEDAGKKIDVAVLDTGAHIAHPDLDIFKCKDTTQKGIKNGCEDYIWHGTHTAGTVGANGGPDGLGIRGVAPASNVWAIKVCVSTECYDDDVAEAIEYAAKRGVEVISMSFGAIEETPIIHEVIKKYPEVLFIAASGNEGPDDDTILYPAAYPEVVAVAANNNSKIITSFSSRGVDDGDNEVITTREVELTAGGSAVESTYLNGCYARASGTSMATPTIAGLAARVWRGDAESTREYLISIAEDITQASGGGADVGYDIASGYGLPVSPDELPPIEKKKPKKEKELDSEEEPVAEEEVE